MQVDTINKVAVRAKINNAVETEAMKTIVTNLTIRTGEKALAATESPLGLTRIPVKTTSITSQVTKGTSQILCSLLVNSQQERPVLFLSL
jgi:hypothetical protein